MNGKAPCTAGFWLLLRKPPAKRKGNRRLRFKQQSNKITNKQTNPFVQIPVRSMDTRLWAAEQAKRKEVGFRKPLQIFPCTMLHMVSSSRQHNRQIGRNRPLWPSSEGISSEMQNRYDRIRNSLPNIITNPNNWTNILYTTVIISTIKAIPIKVRIRWKIVCFSVYW